MADLTAIGAPTWITDDDQIYFDADGNVADHGVEILLGIGDDAGAEPDVWIDIGGLDHDVVQAVRDVVLAALYNWRTA